MAFIPKGATWFIATIVEEIRVQSYKTSSVHINTVLISASSPEEAFQKASEVGKRYNHKYKNVKGQTVECRFRGLRDLNVIHEDLEHGGEIMWTRRERLTPTGVKRLLTKKSELGAFSEIVPLSGPNIMPKSIADELQRRKRR